MMQVIRAWFAFYIDRCRIPQSRSIKRFIIFRQTLVDRPSLGMECTFVRSSRRAVSTSKIKGAFSGCNILYEFLELIVYSSMLVLAWDIFQRIYWRFIRRWRHRGLRTGPPKTGGRTSPKCSSTHHTHCAIFPHTSLRSSNRPSRPVVILLVFINVFIAPVERHCNAE